MILKPRLCSVLNHDPLAICFNVLCSLAFHHMCNFVFFRLKAAFDCFGQAVELSSFRCPINVEP